MGHLVFREFKNGDMRVKAAGRADAGAVSVRSGDDRPGAGSMLREA